MSEIHVHLDTLRRVGNDPEQRHRLFGSAVPHDKYLVRLSQAGVLKTRAKPETECRIDFDTGELVCRHNGEPSKDCRQRLCTYAGLMRMRLVKRLRVAYALERRKLAAQS